MMRPDELRLQRKNTKAFIDANYIDIMLIPRVMVNSGKGQLLEDQAARPSQRLRLIDQTRTNGPEPGTVIAADGQQRKAEFQLLGEHDAVMGVFDYWRDTNGIRYEVVNLIHNNSYEVRAQVVRYGEG